MLLRLAHVTIKLGHKNILQTENLAIYSKVQEILWNKPTQLYEKATMRMSDMHVTMAFLAGIVKFFDDGRLSQFNQVRCVWWSNSKAYAQRDSC